MKRLRFLPTFFIALTVVFVTLVFFRIRSYRDLATKIDDRNLTEAVAQPLADTSGDVLVPAPVAETTTGTVQQPAARGTVPLLEPNARFLLAQPSATAPAQLQTKSTRAPRKAPPASNPAPAPQRPTAAAKHPPAREAAQPQQSSATQREQSSQPQPENSRADRDPAETPRDPNDPTSDSMPPQLATIHFTPPQIMDGEETVLMIQATDDLSGIRSISGTIIAPSGAVQGFACQRDADTNRYIARVIVPKDAAEGKWAVNYLNLMDNASNATALTAARGGLPPSASFQVVSSRPDSQGPSLQAIWLDRRSMRGGEKNVVFVRADDDNSGVNLVSGIFQSPSRQARVGFVCRGGGDGTGVVWR